MATVILKSVVFSPQDVLRAAIQKILRLQWTAEEYSLPPNYESLEPVFIA